MAGNRGTLAFLPLSGRGGGAQTGLCPVRTGGETDINHAKASAAMSALLLLFFLLLLGVASALGLTADTRDSADWRPSDDGRRWSSRTC
ncbi:hypothetical protein GA0070604_6020 [Micromonospora eburnea]|uniref:Uncharacterized protein n=1 Tax=Micromonospora eburnea TaxID=227316 RepID=A0A1C6VN67_9ACTN|nr:hypothetical protein GA0070604_6020 [Micromonospora eburnea]